MAPGTLGAMTENEKSESTKHWFDPIVRRGKAALAVVQELKAVRVFNLYQARRGALLAAGMSYQALFAVFAALYVGFSVAGLWLSANPAVWSALIELINGFVPGLLGTAGQADDALVDPEALVQPIALSVSGVIALVGLVATAIGWIGATRTSMRDIFGLPNDTTFFVLLTLRDLAIALALGAALVVAAAVSVLSTSAAGFIAEFVGVSASSAGFSLLTQAIGLIIIFAIDTLALVVLVRFVSAIRVATGILWRGALLGGVAMAVLQLLGGSLLGGAASNPLLASFTALIGVLIWFNFMNQLLLLVAAWMATGVDDEAHAITGTVGLRSMAERRVLRATERVQKAQQELASAKIIAAALIPEHPGAERSGQAGDPRVLDRTKPEV